MGNEMTRDIDAGAADLDLSAHWTLDPNVTFLNHGSFGAAPRRVLHEQAEIREQIEREPVRFLSREMPARLDRARGELAEFVGAEPKDLVFVPNATTGVNAVLRSLQLEAGDELLVTNHGYPACSNALAFVAERAGARVAVADVAFPGATNDGVVDAILAEVGDQTRLALIDHISSATGLVFPVARIIEELASRGVDVLVDGAHAPGQTPLDVGALGATYYTGNCHKWLCAPKGAAFLWVDPTRQAQVRPTTISLDAFAEPAARFQQEFGWTGTRDVSAYLCVPTCIHFLPSLMPGGWPAIYRRNHALAVRARDLLCETLGVAPPAPDAMVGSMAAVELPDADYTALDAPDFRDPLAKKLFDEADIEVPVVGWPALPKRLIRVSCQLYNTVDQYERLSAVLPAALGGRDVRDDGDLPDY